MIFILSCSLGPLGESSSLILFPFQAVLSVLVFDCEWVPPSPFPPLLFPLFFAYWLVVNSSFPTAGSSSSVGFPYGPYGWTMGPHQSNEYYAGEGGDRDVLSPVDEASVFLSVAMRMGALPVLDANGKYKKKSILLRLQMDFACTVRYESYPRQ